MCTTCMAVAGGFMISAVGNRDEAPGDGPVLGSGPGVFLSLGGPMAVTLRPQSHGRKDCYKRITDPRSRVWSEQEVAGPHGLSESTSLGKHHWPPGRERWAAAFGAQCSPRSRLWQRQGAPGAGGCLQASTVKQEKEKGLGGMPPGILSPVPSAKGQFSS